MSSPTLPSLDVALAVPDELEPVMGILTEASADLAARGIRQWQRLPSPEFRRFMKEQISLGLVALARLPATHEPAGTLRFTWRQDEVWTEEPDSAGYVHTFAIRPALRGRRIGAALLAWAAGYVSGQGRSRLRLDCVASNQALRKYYAGQGFVERGIVTRGEFELARLELDLTPAGHAAITRET